jgi:cell shape-determining protein MreC
MLRRFEYNPSGFSRYDRLYKKLKSKNVFIGLMILSGILIFIPIRWTGPVEKILQAWLAPTGSVTLLAAQKIAGEEEPAQSQNAVSDDQLQRMFVALSLRLQELESENRSLMGIRNAVGPEPSLVPSRVASVAPGRVVGFDSLGLASIEIDRGTFAGVKEGQPVLATIPLNVLQDENLDPKLAIAAGTLVGSIAYGPGPYTSRVQLISAPKVIFSAYVVRYIDGRSKIITRVLVNGTPKGETMVATGAGGQFGIEPGDFVVPADPEKLNLPAPVVLGKISKVDINTENRQLVDLTIEPMFKKLALNKVYVLIPNTSK